MDDLRTSNGSVWSCVKNHSGRTALPENEAPGYWLRKGPTNRQAMFDDYRSTTASAVGTLTVVLQPDLFNGISIWQMEGDTYSITVKDAPGGTVIASKSGDLYEQAAGYYELMLMPLPKLQSVSLYDIPMSATAEVRRVQMRPSAAMLRRICASWQTSARLRLHRPARPPRPRRKACSSEPTTPWACSPRCRAICAPACRRWATNGCRGGGANDWNILERAGTSGGAFCFNAGRSLAGRGLRWNTQVHTCECPRSSGVQGGGA